MVHLGLVGAACGRTSMSALCSLPVRKEDSADLLSGTSPLSPFKGFSRAMAQAKIDGFARRLYLNNSRTALPQGALRRCVGAAPGPGQSVVSRFGSTLLYPLPNCISLTKYNNTRYQYDGSVLYKNGVSLDTGYNGGRLAFVKAPPALGVPDYLFLTGGGKFKKVDTSGTITNWGIAPPLDGMVGTLGPQDITVIDSFDTSAANWTAFNCTKANESTIVYAGNGSLKVVATAGPWEITKDVSSGGGLNLSTYSNGDISLQTDLISFWLYMKKPAEVAWLWVLFDVGDGTFKNDYYRLVVQVVSQTANVHAANADVILNVDADRWVQIAAPKSLFTRVGTALDKDWSAVQKIVSKAAMWTEPIPPRRFTSICFNSMVAFRWALVLRLCKTARPTSIW